MDLAELEALTRDPGGGSWQVLCAGLAGLEADRLERAVEVLAAALDAWPDSLCRWVPDAWKHLYLESAQLHPLMRLPNALLLDGVTTQQMNRLSASAGLAHIRELHLSGGAQGRLGDDGLAALAEAGPARLRSLTLPDNAIGAAGLQALVDGLPELRDLNLMMNAIGDAGVRVLARAGALTRLEDLRLQRTDIGLGALEALGARGALPALRRLHLGWTRLGPSELAAWETVEALGELEQLSLRSIGFGDEGAVALSKVAALGKLEDLDLRENVLGDRGLQALARWPTLASLKRINLAFNRVGDEGFAALVSSPLATGLEALELYSNQVGDHGARALAGSELDSLRTLDLSNNPIGEAGAVALAAAPQLASLTTLKLIPAPIGPTGASALIDSPHLRPELKKPIEREWIRSDDLFDVVLVQADSKKVRMKVAKAMRSQFGLSKRDAMAFAEGAPRIIKDRCGADDAENLRAYFERTGAVVKLEPWERKDPPA